MQNYKDPYLKEETYEDVYRFVKKQLELGSTVGSIANAMLGNRKGELIITKWYGTSLMGLNREEQICIFTRFINEELGEYIPKICLSKDVQERVMQILNDIDLDAYGDYLTELMSKVGYREVNNHITEIIASFHPYMMENRKEEFEAMSGKELQVALVNYIKENLQICSKEDETI
ncbi:hypothetical protein [Sulfurimonas indica]|uniref:hypothetical protein n=2 Tax=Sulfurimonas TaxID=202746 RepID=UPI0012657845|nr:hypothetical protein [Sulfurimonas indica]